MFETPHHKHLDKAHEHGLTAIVPAAQLVLKHKRQDTIQNLAKTSHLASARFQALCEKLIFNLLDYMQQLPDTTNSYFSSPGGAFDHALSRTAAANELFQTFVLQDPGAKLSEEQQLWWYALFSAGLLRGIGKLPLDYDVQLYNHHAHLIKTWEPLLEPLARSCHAYKFDTVNHNLDESFRQRLNILLAKSLMPKEGFAWLAQNLDVLEVWLALLHEDAASSGTLGLILDRADAIAIQDDLVNPPPHAGRARQPTRRGTSFIDIPDESLLDKEQLAGIEFIKWLMASLEASKLTLNQYPLLNVPGGTLIGPDTFKLFVRESSEFKNWLAVKQGLESLDIDDKTNTKQKEGVVLKNSIGLPDKLNFKVSEKAAAKESLTIDAKAGEARQVLTATGTWVAVEQKQNPSLKPKANPFD